ncbi:MAG: hypothetical protein GY786_03100 [Proteobacteria bacterium]|nr:hypothetical protein [Pseudomonadota bacterium]
MVVFSMLWGIAGSYETNERKIFEELLRSRTEI